MKFKLYLILGISLAAASCSGNHHNYNNDTATSLKPEDTALARAPNAPVVNMEYCFYHADGTSAQDSTKVSLHINGDKVTGNMSWLPKQKDKRKGALAGTLKGNAIKALWTYRQEGKKDTLSVEFQLRDNKLAQKPYRYDAKTGKQQTNDTADYSIIYNMKNCN